MELISPAENRRVGTDGPTAGPGTTDNHHDDDDDDGDEDVGVMNWTLPACAIMQHAEGMLI